MAEELLMEDDTQDRNTGQMATIPISDTQALAKPPTLNSLLVDKMDAIDCSIADSLALTQHLTVLRANQATIIMQNWMNMILSGLGIVGIIVLLVCFGFLFGRFVP